MKVCAYVLEFKIVNNHELNCLLVALSMPSTQMTK
jgi:hypothetical protein